LPLKIEHNVTYLPAWEDGVLANIDLFVSPSGHKLVYDQDYVVEYSSQTGHYRIRLLNPNLEVSAVQFQAVWMEQEPVYNQEENSETTFSALDHSVLQQLTDYLRELGYIVTANRLQLWLDEGPEKKISINDLELIFQQTANYSYDISLTPTDGKSDLERARGFLNSAGKAQVQCRTAGLIFADVLNWYFQRMGNTQFSARVEACYSVVGEAAAAADLHARVHVYKGERKIGTYDTTPREDPVYVDAIVRRESPQREVADKNQVIKRFVDQAKATIGSIKSHVGVDTGDTSELHMLLYQSSQLIGYLTGENSERTEQIRSLHRSLRLSSPDTDSNGSMYEVQQKLKKAKLLLDKVVRRVAKSGNRKAYIPRKLRQYGDAHFVSTLYQTIAHLEQALELVLN
jgi:hypothetical protein